MMNNFTPDELKNIKKNIGLIYEGECFKLDNVEELKN